MLKFAIAMLCTFASAAHADLTETTEDMMMDIEIQIMVNAEEIPFMSPPTSKVGISEVECLAVAAYHEARSEGLLGQIAVTSVILQRAAVPGRWGTTACEVVTDVQFSFMTSDTTFPEIKDITAWSKALAVANHMARNGPIKDLPFVDHYHTEKVTPKWRLKMTKVVQIGAHIFYADPISIRRISSSS